MVSEDTDVLIVGGSVAWVRCATTLRTTGHTGKLRLVEAEPADPYDEPPLSKGFLTAHKTISRLTTASALHELGIDYRSGSLVLALNVRDRTVLADDGAIRFGILVVATGYEPQTLPLPVDAALPDAALPSGHLRTPQSWRRHIAERCPRSGRRRIPWTQGGGHGTQRGRRGPRH